MLEEKNLYRKEIIKAINPCSNIVEQGFITLLWVVFYDNSDYNRSINCLLESWCIT